MKKLSVALLCLILPFLTFFCGCTSSTKLSKLCGISASDIEDVRFGYRVQSYTQIMQEKNFKAFFVAIDVEYVAEDNDKNSISDENHNMCMFYAVTLKGNRNLYLEHHSNLTISAEYCDGENSHYYVSCNKVYIPWYITKPA